MKDGVGKGFTREDHYDVSNQLFASYSKVQDARSLASVIGEDELSELDKQYLAFGDAFERKFVHQSLVENRTIAETLDLGWKLLTMLPRGYLLYTSRESPPRRASPPAGRRSPAGPPPSGRWSRP